MISENQANAKTSECINSLTPLFREEVGRWIEAMLSKGIKPYVYFGFRSIEEQRRIYDSGVRPCAEPGKSMHNYGMSIDWVPLKKIDDVRGTWFEADWDNEDAYRVGVEVGIEFGLVPISTETGHLQDIRYKTWQDAKRSFEQAQWPTA